MKLKVLAVILGSLLAVPAFGQSFQIGGEGFDIPGNNWPGGENPTFVIDGASQKYLNFGQTDTGFAVVPVSGSTVATSLTLWAANDSPERDPASYEVWGSNEATPADLSTGVEIPLAAFTAISTGDVTLPETRGGGGTDPFVADTSFSVSFANTNAYTSYLVLFPTIKGPDANSMQVADVQLFDGAGTGIFAPGDAVIGGQRVAAVPEPSTGILALLCMIPVMSYIRRRR